VPRLMVHSVELSTAIPAHSHHRAWRPAICGRSVFCGCVSRPTIAAALVTSGVGRSTYRAAWKSWPACRGFHEDGRSRHGLSQSITTAGMRCTGGPAPVRCSVVNELPITDHELDAPPWRRVEATLMATSRAIRRLYDARLKPLDLNLSEASVLCLVHEQGPISQTHLSEAMGMGRASTGKRVAELQRRGLLIRAVDPDDARAWLVLVMPAGAAMSVRIVELDVALRRELRTGLDRDERLALAGALQRIRANVAAAFEQAK
jgi:DNA-binding MarR family transcriptional regulator